MSNVQAVYPGLLTFPSASIFPAVPGQHQNRPRFTGSNGTSVPVLVITDVSESSESNTLIHPRRNSMPFVDLRPWSPATLTITCIIESLETYKHLRALYASGAIVTLHDTGNPWNGTKTLAAGSFTYSTLNILGRPALIEARFEVLEQ